MDNCELFLSGLLNEHQEIKNVNAIFLDEDLSDLAITQTICKTISIIYNAKAYLKLLGIKKYVDYFQMVEDKYQYYCKYIPSKEHLNDSNLKVEKKLDIIVHHLFSGETETNLTFNNSNKILVYTILEYIQVYLKRVIVESNKKIQVIIQSEEDILVNLKDGMNIYKILYQICCNAIIHGYSSKDMILKIAVKKVENQIILDIKNNGNPIDYDILKYKAKKMNIKYLDQNELLFVYSLTCKDDFISSRNSGIGLYIVKEIVKQYKGKIAITSTDNYVMFKVLLPI